MDKKVKRIVISALLAALTCVATMIIKIPSPLKGYINMGDCFVLLAGWLLSPAYGFMAAGLGSALADVLSGYVVYAPATFIIKGIMALIAHFLMHLVRKRITQTASGRTASIHTGRTASIHTGQTASLVISGVVAELTMVSGYFLFEGFMYGFVPSIVNIPANTIQGIAGLILGIVLIKVTKKSKITLD